LASVLQFSTASVENFVGKARRPPRKARPVSLGATLPSFAAGKVFQQNQQLRSDGGFADDAPQQEGRDS
jgi:hypothetical protein